MTTKANGRLSRQNTFSQETIKDIYKFGLNLNDYNYYFDMLSNVILMSNCCFFSVRVKFSYSYHECKEMQVLLI